MPSINITNLNNGKFFNIDTLSNDDFEKLKNFKSSKPIAVIPATLFPVRTNSMKNFAKDFFLPTTLNRAIKVNAVGAKVFAVLLALVLDTLTFPIRLLTCIPRAISNYRKEENPLLKYLKEQKVDPQLLSSDTVRVKLYWDVKEKFPSTQWTDAEGIEHKDYKNDLHMKKQTVNFIQLPLFKGWDDSPTNSVNAPYEL